MKKPLKHIIKNFSITKSNLIALGLFVFLAIFILYPLARIIQNSFVSNAGYSLQAYKETFDNPSTYKAFKNTLAMVSGTLIIAWTLGFSFAFLKVKTDFKFKKYLDTMVFLTFCIPSYILSISWIEIMSRGGYLNRLLRLFNPHIRYGFNAYSLTASAIILGIHLYPLVYYAMSVALNRMSGALEQSAKICGASKYMILKSIVTPLLLPTFLSTGLLVVSRSMANFAVTAQLALPSGKEVLTTRLFSALSDLNLSQVSVIALVIIGISSCIYLITEKVSYQSKYQFSGGNSSVNHVFHLGKISPLIHTLFLIFFGITIVLPYVSIVVSSFLKRWGLHPTLANMTLSNYSQLFTGNAIIVRPLLNSLMYGILAATLAAFIASFTVYLYTFCKNNLSKALMLTTTIPVAFPNMILAIGATLAWLKKPLKLYGSKWIIIVTYMVLFIPIISRQISGVSKNIDLSSDRAGQTLGIPMRHRYIKLYCPQIKDGIISGYILCFLISLREVPIALLLYAAGTQTLGVLLFTIQSNSYGLEMTSTVAVIVIVISLIGHILLNKFVSNCETL